MLADVQRSVDDTFNPAEISVFLMKLRRETVMLSRYFLFALCCLEVGGAAGAADEGRDAVWRELLSVWRNERGALGSTSAWGLGDDDRDGAWTMAEGSAEENVRPERFISEEGGSTEERGSTLAFVFDSTGSMNQELNQVKVGASKILAALRDHPNVPIRNYVLVPFGDPEIGPVTVTTNHSLFKESIQNITVFGGGDCPEMSIGAIKKALQLSLPNSYVYVFTDASAKDFQLLSEVLSFIQRKRSQVDFIMTDDCGSYTDEGYRAYEKIAETSSGQIYRLDKFEVKEVLKYVKVALQPNVVNLLSQNKPAPPKNVPDEHEVLVDTTLQQFTISVSGANASISVTDPKGKSIDGPPQLESLLHLSNVKIVNVKEPDPGPWKVFISSDSDYRLRSTGLSGVNFNHGFSTADTATMAETNYRPLKGASCRLFIQTSDAYAVSNITTVDLVDMNGDVIRRLALKPAPNVEGLYKTDAFLPPSGFFYLGYKLKRAFGIPTSLDSIPERASSINLDTSSYSVMRLRAYEHKSVPISFSQTCEVTLSITETTLNSTGNYTCVARSIAGSSSSNVYLNVSGEIPKIETVSSVKAKAGEDVLLPCFVMSGLPYHVSWSRPKTRNDSSGNTHLAVKGEKLMDDSLLLKSVQPEDEGWYECTAENGEGRSQARVHLMVEAPLVVTAWPVNVTYEEGELLRFKCAASGLPRPRLEWRRHGTAITRESPLLFVEETERTLDLVFHSSSRENAGEYECHAVSSSDSGSAVVELIYTEKPFVTTANRTVLAKDGEAVQLRCKATGEPLPTMKWYKNGKEILPDTRITVDDDGSLMLDPARTWDSGEFVCEAANLYGSHRENVSLLVGTQPTFLERPRDKSIEMSQAGTVPCSALGVPPPEVRWTRRDGRTLDSEKAEVLKGGTLRISDMGLDDVGYYVCTAENVLGAVSAEVKIDIHGIEKPVMNEVLELTVVRGASGSDLSIPCGVTLGNPPGTVRWFKDGAVVEVGNRTEIDRNGNLNVVDSRVADGGNYVCVVSNRAGKSSRSFDIVISESPKNSSESLKGKKGGEITVLCPAVGFPRATITWMKDGRLLPISPSIFQNDNGSLIIRNLSEEDSGVYVCIGRDSLGSASGTVSVEVYVPPELVEDGQYQSLNIVEGYLAVLNCYTKSVPKATVHWYKNGNVLLENDIKYQEEPEILRFLASVNDTAVYKCEASNEAGSIQKEFNVTVLVPPRILGRKTGGSIRVRAGTSSTLECRVHGVPFPNILWQRNGMYLTQNSSDVTITNEGLLILENVTTESAGAYVCEAENPAGIVQRMYYLQVHYPPRIRDAMNVSQEIRLREGEEYSLPCQVEGNPKPLVLWRKNGFVVREDGNDNMLLLGDNTLVLLQVETSTSGTYKCEATNEEGSAYQVFHVEVLTPPVLVPENYHTREKVNEGEPITLTCPISDSVPPPTIQWIKDGKPLNSLLRERSDEAQIKLTSDHRQLVIAEAHPADRGNYSCTATNSAGRADARFLVDVLMTPHFEEFNHIAHRTIVAGGEVSLNCSVSGNPQPKVTWRKEKVPVTTDNNPGVHVSLDRQHLVIRNGKVHHSGTYICTAVNEVSRKEREFYVSVLEPPHISGSPHEEMEALAGESVQFHCPYRGVPPPTVLWWKHGKVKSMLAGGMDRFTIDNVTCENSGRYMCEVSNVAGTKTKTFTVTVLEPPNIENGSVVDKMVAREGENVSLRCRASGHPRPDIAWLHNGRVMHNMKMNRVRRGLEEVLGDLLVFEDGLVSLTLSNVTDDRAGIYTILASNRAGTVEKSFEVSVLSEPKLQGNHSDIHSVTVLESSSINLGCPVTADPPPEIRWFHGKAPILNAPGIRVLGNRLLIARSGAEHAGMYSCLAENIVGNLSIYFDVSVIERPRLNDTGVVFGAHVNETVDISCGGIQNEGVRYDWIHKSSAVVNSSRLKISGNGRKLKISRVTFSDSGEYTCVVSNAAGYTEIKYELEVVEAPVLSSDVDMDSKREVELHHPLSLDCPFVGHPAPEISWYKNERRMDHNDSHDNVQIRNGLLFILRASGEDVGMYKCIARNKAGRSELEFAVDVYVAAEWKEWSEWSECSVSCGVGEQKRVRHCMAAPENSLDSRVRLVRTKCVGDGESLKPCIAHCEVNGGWGSWSKWTPDSATCGRVTRKRYRFCNNPEPANNGKYCEGTSVEEYSSFANCTRDIGWSDWSAWSACSQSCNGGWQQRRRKCSLHGRPCLGLATEKRECNQRKCPGSWLSWSEWSPCSATCGRGHRKRERRCRSEPEECVGENLQIENCFSSTCSKDFTPSLANLEVKGNLNGRKLHRRFSANMGRLEEGRSLSTSTRNLLDHLDGWFPYEQFLLSPLVWSTAYETDNAHNGYSLTDGNYLSLSDVKFSTGEGLTVKHKGEGIDPSGALQVQVEVFGEVPLLEYRTSLVVQNFEQDFVQASPNTLYSIVQNHLDIDGEALPFVWNNTIHYSNAKGTMPYLVEKLSIKDGQSAYNPKTQNITYTALSKIGKKFEENICPSGFRHTPEAMHCQDVDECEDAEFRCGQGGHCINTFGSFECTCDEGFVNADDGTACLDVDECSLVPSICSDMCRNILGSFACSCPLGYTLSEDQKTCEVLPPQRGGIVGFIDRRARLERAHEYGGLQSHGTPPVNGSCPPGFESISGQCTDRDECHQEPDLCDEDEICVNTLGSYQCLSIPCPEGFIRDASSKSCHKRCDRDCKLDSPEILSFHAITVTSSYPLKDILQLDVRGSADVNTAWKKFRVVESEELFRVREYHGKGSLYALRILNKDTLYRVTVRAISFGSKGNYLSIVEFIIFIIVI